MAKQLQIPGGPYVNETTNDESQIPGGPYLNQTSGSSTSTVSVGSASETDTAQAIARAKFYAVLHAAETNSAQTITRYLSGIPVLSAATVINIATTTVTPRVTVTI